VKLFLIILSISLGAAVSNSQELVVTNDAFYLDGKEAPKLRRLNLTTTLKVELLLKPVHAPTQAD